VTQQSIQMLRQQQSKKLGEIGSPQELWQTSPVV